MRACVRACVHACVYVLLTKHPGNTVQYMPERRSHEGMYRVRYCPHARSIIHLLHARLGYQHFFPFFFLLYSGSKSSPYRIILDWLSGQYREIWTGLGCRGLASCMTTVTCRVISICMWVSLLPFLGRRK